jgi:hypothetical protein
MISYVYRMDENNVGDWNCSPHTYFDLGPKKLFTIGDIGGTFDQISDTVVFGGGGMLIPPRGKNAEKIHEIPRQMFELMQTNRTYIGWGIGHNEGDKRGQTKWDDEFTYPSFDRFKLYGLRDYDKGHRWVPCVSCMYSGLDRNYEINHDIVVYEHRRIPMYLSEFPTLTNEHNNLAEIIEFLGSGETVITNSYHGAYWASMLGRKVIAMPWSSKFCAMRHAPMLAHPSEWKDAIIKAHTYPDALEECRDANIKFSNEVREIINA